VRDRQGRQANDAIGRLQRRVASMVIGTAHGQVEHVAPDELDGLFGRIIHDLAYCLEQLELVGLGAETGQSGDRGHALLVKTLYASVPCAAVEASNEQGRSASTGTTGETGDGALPKA
jgi:hypothetical protein